ncbi:hypothetical protein HWV62_32989 [Athelia sp. TMB]|nr:hypothetical protein HWV62_32989 [Athelia sp. TMB]
MSSHSRTTMVSDRPRQPPQMLTKRLRVWARSDGMPPLVDNPNPYPYPMAYTFCSEFEMAPPAAILAPPPPEYPPGLGPCAGEDDPAERPSSHGKKRDASYIPRPPNAFILFRSSFIKSQQVPGKVEGNHSTLSKIIGIYWKALPLTEKAIWEDKAQAALADHRRRYPDWRFRPGANALAKAKVKDGGGGKAKSTRGTKKKPKRERDKDKDKEKAKDPAAAVKPEPGHRAPAKSDARRCAKIADFLVAGKSGVDLERALQAWEAGLPGDDARVSVSPAQAVADAYKADTDAARSPSPVPLTSMFKRVPAADDGCMSPVFEEGVLALGHWSDPFDFPMPCLSPTSASDSDSASAGVATPRLDFAPFDYDCDLPAFDCGSPVFDFAFVPGGYDKPSAYPQWTAQPRGADAYSSYSSLTDWAGAGLVGMGY